MYRPSGQFYGSGRRHGRRGRHVRRGRGWGSFWRGFKRGFTSVVKPAWDFAKPIVQKVAGNVIEKKLGGKRRGRKSIIKSQIRSLLSRLRKRKGGRRRMVRRRRMGGRVYRIPIVRRRILIDRPMISAGRRGRKPSRRIMALARMRIGHGRLRIRRRRVGRGRKRMIAGFGKRRRRVRRRKGGRRRKVGRRRRIGGRKRRLVRRRRVRRRRVHRRRR